MRREEEKMQLLPLEKEKSRRPKIRVRCNRKGGGQRDKIMLQFVLPTTQCTIVVQKLPHFARGLGGRGGREGGRGGVYCLLFIGKGRKKKCPWPP